MGQVSFLTPPEAAMCSLAEEALRLVAEFRGRYAAGGLTAEPGALSMSSPEKVYEEMRHLGLLMQEQLWVLVLDRKYRVLERVMVYQGTAWTVQVRNAELLRPAIVAGASAIVLVHNHPSGDADPSADDVHMTAKLAEACETMSIEFLDHVVIGRGCWASLVDRGLMPKGGS